jgi:hypothetical protein
MPEHPYKMIAYHNKQNIKLLKKFMETKDYQEEYTMEDMKDLIKYAYEKSLSISKELQNL